MRRTALLLTAGVLTAPWAFGQDDPQTNPAEKFKCNLKNVQTAWWCEEDQYFPPEEEIVKPDKKSKNKNTMHKDTEHILVQRKACIQVYYECMAHPETPSRNPGKCASCKKELEKQSDIAAYLFVCVGCGGKGEDKQKVKHNTSEGHDSNIVASCDRAGAFPHNVDK